MASDALPWQLSLDFAPVFLLPVLQQLVTVAMPSIAATCTQAVAAVLGNHGLAGLDVSPKADRGAPAIGGARWRGVEPAQRSGQRSGMLVLGCTVVEVRGGEGHPPMCAPA